MKKLEAILSEMIEILKGFAPSTTMDSMVEEWDEKQNALTTYLNLVSITEGGIDTSRRAISFIQRLEDIDLPSDKSNTWLLIGGCFSSIGDFKRATEMFKIALEIDPESESALHGLAMIDSNVEYDCLKSIVNNISKPFKKRIASAFTLGKSYDRIGDYDSAFFYFKAGNDLSKRFYGINKFEPDDLREKINHLLSIEISVDALADSELPVFVVGMPRSGTTLVEQILASHSQIVGAGELFDIGRIATDFSEKITFDLINLHRSVYLSKLQTIGGDALRVVDKMPDNVYWLGTVATMFPRARIIFCHRDIRDVCLSCYFQNFSNFIWSYDLANTFIQANEIERLMDGWKNILPNPIYDLSYETLVNDNENESKRLLEFLGLDWEENCLNFHETERQILTAILWQVRQPLYNNSVARWKNYERYIDEIL